MDLILRRGTVIDGVAANVYQADVGVVDDIITRVGDLANATARHEIDAAGLVVTPGFIDLSSASALALLAEPTGLSKLAQGVTTEAVCLRGEAPFPNAGGAAPLVTRAAERLGIEPAWRDAAGYLKRLREAEPAQNVAVLAGHGTLRAFAAGLARRATTAHDLARMRERLAEDLACGLFGLSVALDRMPGAAATEDELSELAGLLDPSRHHLAIRLNSAPEGTTPALDRALRVARRAGVPLQITDLTPAGDAAERDAAELAARLDAARSGGADVTSDASPYPAEAAPLARLLPDWALADGREATLRRLRDTLVRARVRSAIRAALPDAAAFARVRIAWVARAEDAWMIGHDLAEIHARAGRGRDPAETLLDLLARNELEVDALLFHRETTACELLRDRPWQLCGSGAPVRGLAGPSAEGIPHPASFGAFPRRLRLAHEEGGLRALAAAVRAMTSLPAARLRLPDRGRIAPGYRADLCLLDPRRLRDMAWFERPCQPPVGLRAVLVNGKVAHREGEGALARAGRVLRPGPPA